jgi:crotonobetainyl-CoA:carnitine CoA-transferase CaiB-like acyl-CoA transferase
MDSNYGPIKHHWTVSIRLAERDVVEIRADHQIKGGSRRLKAVATLESGEGLLSGIRVLEFGQFIAGPRAGRMMADLGAEVIKIELAPNGDLMRNYPPIKEGQSGVFVLENRGKRSLCLDFNRPEGAEILKALAAKADVVIENFSPGVLPRRGLDYALLSHDNPGLVMCSISGFGQSGPFARRPSNDRLALAMSGIMHLTGAPDGPPMPIGTSMADSTAGVHAFAAICAALFGRGRTGRGQYIDISLMETLFHTLDLPLATHLLSNGEVQPQRCGLHNPTTAPTGTFKARDGYVVISAFLHQWEAFANAIGKPELLTDPRFSNATERANNRLALAEIIEEWLQSFPSRDEPLAILAEHRVISGPVLDVAGATNHPQMKARHALQEVTHPGIGPLPLPVAPMRFSNAAVAIHGRTPALGEHNETILTELGYTPERIAELTQSGVLVSTVPADWD